MKNNKPLVSIVVPIYNVEKYIDRCISSISNQTYGNIEIILVDDGSKDSSPEKCDSWNRIDERVVVIHKSNGGLADARNCGVDNATGEYISFVDGDDSIDPAMIESMVEALLTYEAQIACCGKQKIYDNGNTEAYQCRKSLKVYSGNEAIDELFCGYYIDESFCDKIFKIDLLRKFKFPLGEVNEDLPILPDIFSLCKNVVHIGAPLYNYHQNEGSITRSGYNIKMHVVLEHLLQLQEKYSKDNSDTLDMLFIRYSVAMLCRMNIDKLNANEEYFKKDKISYYGYLKKNYIKYIISDRVCLKDKVLATLIITKLLSFANYIRKK